MKNPLYTIIFAVALGFFIPFILKLLKGKRSPRSKNTNDSSKYRKKFLLSQNERQYFYIIKSVTDSLGLYLFTKVRLADLIEPIPRQSNYNALFNRIRSKHVDFVVCSQTVTTMCVIELDDSSHDKTDRKERDDFVDELLKNCGIPIIRARHINKESLIEEIKKYL